MDTQNTNNTDKTQYTHNTHNKEDASYQKKFTGTIVPTNETLTGKDVGRMMLTDLCLTWEQMNGGKHAETHKKNLFSAEEKASLVASLHTEEDIREYNIYREIHTALLRMPERFSLARTRAELAFWRLHTLILNFHHTEQEHTEKFLEPFIMTEIQYQDYRRIYSEQDLDENFPGGIAIMKRGEVQTDEKGYYCTVDHTLSSEYSAETMLDGNDILILTLYNTLSKTLRECFAILTGICLIAKRVDVPMLNDYIQETVPEDEMALLNKLIEDTPNQITRFLLHSPQIDQERTDMLRSETKKMLPFIDLEALKPTPQAISQATLFLNDITNTYQETGRLFSLLEEVTL